MKKTHQRQRCNYIYIYVERERERERVRELEVWPEPGILPFPLPGRAIARTRLCPATPRRRLRLLPSLRGTGVREGSARTRAPSRGSDAQRRCSLPTTARSARRCRRAPSPSCSMGRASRNGLAAAAVLMLTGLAGCSAAAALVLPRSPFAMRPEPPMPLWRQANASLMLRRLAGQEDDGQVVRRNRMEERWPSCALSSRRCASPLL